MNNFAETRFPTDISYGSHGGPGFLTEVVESHGGFETRNLGWSAARARYDVAHGVKTQAQMDALIAFFYARRGRAQGFRFKDWSDFAAVDAPLGTGNGGQKKFQLAKRYSNGGEAYSRAITKPVAGTLSVKVNGVVAAVSVDNTTGVVTFATAPASGAVLTASVEFDVPVRFDTDKLDVTLEELGVFSARAIPLVELRLPPASLEG